MASIREKLKFLKWWQYVLLALAIHIIPFLIWGGMVIAPAVTDVLQFKGTLSLRQEAPSRPERPPEVKRTGKAGGAAGAKINVANVPGSILQPQKEVKQRIVSSGAGVAAGGITVGGPQGTGFGSSQEFAGLPGGVEPEKANLSGFGEVEKSLGPVGNLISKAQAERHGTWKQFSKQFKISGRGRSISTQATLTVYEAQASGMEAGIDKYAIPNLMGEIDKRTNVKANPTTVVASVKDYAGLSKCPYVYMAGRGDFSFSAEEVTNLRKYIMGGGTIFADNCLPGKRSGFDIAFRREMKRVLPDREFEILPMSHTIFNIFYQFYEVPKGLNFRNDPIEVIMIDDKPGVIYTLNGYSFFWESRLDAAGNVDHGYRDDYTYAHGSHWDQLEYENINQESVEAAYQLGINILVYLLTGIGKY